MGDGKTKAYCHKVQANMNKRSPACIAEPWIMQLLAIFLVRSRISNGG